MTVTGNAMWACLEIQQSHFMQMSSEAMQQLPIGAEDIRAHAIVKVIVHQKKKFCHHLLTLK